jgi:hypothetical protein
VLRRDVGVAFKSAMIRLTAEAVKNLSAASGVAYIRRGAILTFLAAPNAAPKKVFAKQVVAKIKANFGHQQWPLRR